jgi:hypothetical protein
MCAAFGVAQPRESDLCLPFALYEGLHNMLQ